MTGLVVLLAVLAACSALGVLRARTDGRLRGRDDAERLDPALRERLGLPADARLVLLQFSTAFCAPCRTTRAVLARVADQVDGVHHVEVDAEAELDAVRALGITRTPTTLVVRADGRVVGRAAGAPRLDEVRATVQAALA